MKWQESWEIFFFYRPKVNKEEAYSPDDVLVKKVQRRRDQILMKKVLVVVKVVKVGMVGRK